MPEQEPSKDVVPLEEVTPAVDRFLGTVFGAPGFEVAELIAAELRSVRFARSIRLAERAEEQLKRAGRDPKKVPLRTLFPLLEGGSLEDDEDLVERWASLLANAASGGRDMPPSFARVLRELEPVEAAILDELYVFTMRLAPEFRRRKHGLNGLDTAKAHGLTEEEYHYHADNFARLGLIWNPPEPQSTPILVMTDFGRVFVRACWPPDRPDPPVHWTDGAEIMRVSRENKKRRAEQRAIEQAATS